MPGRRLEASWPKVAADSRKTSAQAKDWNEKAAKAGNVEAQSGLGWMLTRRESDPASVEEGIGWLEKTASYITSPRGMEALRASEALSRLAKIYRSGFLGVPADPQKAAGFTRRIDEYEARARERLEAIRAAHPEFRSAANVRAVSTTQATPTQRAFAYPQVSARREVPVRPERHNPASIATIRSLIARALARTLPCCPCCGRP